jgi:hypothetical protein
MRTDRMSGLLLLILALSSNACIVTYQVEQPATMESFQLPRKDLTLNYSYIGPHGPGVSHKALVSLAPGSYPLVTTEQGSDEFERVLASKEIFAQMPNPPDQGLYCRIRVLAHHSALGEYIYHTPVQPGSKEDFIVQASGSLFPLGLLIPLTIWLQVSTAIVPWWSSGAGYTVEYILYIDGEQERSYSYEITKKGVGWIGLLPMAWINLFTQDAKDAFRATAYQFVHDADRDGHFGGK